MDSKASSSDYYEKTLKSLNEDLRDRLSERIQINGEIARLRRTIAAMERMLAGDASDQREKKGLTASIGSILKRSDWLTPMEIRDELKKAGIDAGAYQNMLAEVHTILKRLVASGKVEVNAKPRKPVYRWKG